MSTTVLSQLKTIEAELAAQEEQLVAQLASVQEKLTGIRAVLPMFNGTATVADTALSSNKPKEVAAVAEKTTVAKASTAKKKAAKVTATKKSTAKKKAAKVTATKKTTAKKKAAKVTATKKSTAKKKTVKKKDGRTATWQKYTRPGVKNESIPDAVKLILETQPNKDFKIAEVMDSLFKEDMPKTQYLKARNRISNVLSGGVRAGDWFKGARGTYRMTAA